MVLVSLYREEMVYFEKVINVIEKQFEEIIMEDDVFVDDNDIEDDDGNVDNEQNENVVIFVCI